MSNYFSRPASFHSFNLSICRCWKIPQPGCQQLQQGLPLLQPGFQPQILSTKKNASGNQESTVTSSFEKIFRDTPFLCPWVYILIRETSVSLGFSVNEDYSVLVTVVSLCVRLLAVDGHATTGIFHETTQADYDLQDIEETEYFRYFHLGGNDNGRSFTFATTFVDDENVKKPPNYETRGNGSKFQTVYQLVFNDAPQWYQLVFNHAPQVPPQNKCQITSPAPRPSTPSITLDGHQIVCA